MLLSIKVSWYQISPAVTGVVCVLPDEIALFGVGSEKARFPRVEGA